MRDDFEELVGGVEDLEPAERERLQRVHELLLEAGPPPELPVDLRQAPTVEPIRLLPRRRRSTLALIAAALVTIAFGSGYLLGGRSDDASVFRSISMTGVGEGRDGFASIEILEQDEAGNWPMVVRVRGLQESRSRDDFYELWLTKDGKLADSCGRFVVHDGVTEVALTVPYGFKRYDGWVVTRHGSAEPLLST
ncbi:MAG: hypothetical protein MSC30_14865 [Gaiellaceae bacterium MAG52_C11]|nr:hypothetical protein [Candidatus Gaiellasilicea maunaloa]